MMTGVEAEVRGRGGVLRSVLGRQEDNGEGPSEMGQG